MDIDAQTKLNVSEVTTLLGDLCVVLGFCLPPDESARLLETPPEEVNAFTDAVFLAEGMNPQHSDRRLYRQVQTMIADAFRLHHKNQDKMLLEGNQRAMQIARKSKFKKRNNSSSGKLKDEAKSKRNKTF